MIINTHLNDLVLEAFNNATANGYTFSSANELAIDMCSYDADLEEYPVEEVEQSIIELKLLEPRE